MNYPDKCIVCGITERLCISVNMLDGTEYNLCLEHRQNILNVITQAMAHPQIVNSHIEIDWSMSDDTDDDTDNDTDEDGPDGVLAEAYRLAREQGWEVGGYM